jgi:hypothetical protein
MRRHSASSYTSQVYQIFSSLNHMQADEQTPIIGEGAASRNAAYFGCAPYIGSFKSSAPMFRSGMAVRLRHANQGPMRRTR